MAIASTLRLVSKLPLHGYAVFSYHCIVFKREKESFLVPYILKEGSMHMCLANQYGWAIVVREAHRRRFGLNKRSENLVHIKRIIHC